MREGVDVARSIPCDVANNWRNRGRFAASVVLVVFEQAVDLPGWHPIRGHRFHKGLWRDIVEAHRTSNRLDSALATSSWLTASAR
jgi:hypothetical protein